MVLGASKHCWVSKTFGCNFDFCFMFSSHDSMMDCFLWGCSPKHAIYVLLLRYPPLAHCRTHCCPPPKIILSLHQAPEKQQGSRWQRGDKENMYILLNRTALWKYMINYTQSILLQQPQYCRPSNVLQCSLDWLQEDTPAWTETHKKVSYDVSVSNSDFPHSQWATVWFCCFFPQRVCLGEVTDHERPFSHSCC